MALTEKQRRFVEAYMGQAAGNATEAARVAGFGNPKSQGSRLLTFVDVKKAIEERQKADPLVASREERQRFLTAAMRGEHGGELKDRIKATEVLGKAQGDFVERHEHSVVLSFAQLVEPEAGE